MFSQQLSNWNVSGKKTKQKKTTTHGGWCLGIVWKDTSQGSKESIDSTTTTFPSIWTMIIHTSYWSMVFSCLEVVLKHMIERQTIRQRQWDVKNTGRKWLSYFYSHYLFACCSTRTWHEGKYRENLSKWNNRAARVGFQERSTEHVDELTVWVRHYKGSKRRTAQKKNCIEK